jgi:hypothetical protein
VIVVHVARKPLDGLSVARNAVQNASGGLNIQASRIPLQNGEDLSSDGDGGKLDGQGNWGFKRVARDGQLGRWPTNVLLSPVAAQALDDLSSVNSWGASRFFKTIHEDKPRTKVVTLARKPAGMTVIQAAANFGAGGLNLDACRIASEKIVGWGGKPAGGMTWDESNCGLCKDGEARPQTGRWPANLILEHRMVCRNAGVIEDSQMSHNRWDDGAKPFGGGAGHAYTKVDLAPLPVDVWHCAPGCPAGALNEQSGVLVARKHDRGAHRAFSPLLDQGEPMERVCGYDDAGGAARFFKQVKP